MAVDQFDFASATIQRADRPASIPVDRETVTAFLGRTERGPANEPVRIRSLDEYRRIFGGQCDFSFLPHAVQHYFLNAGTQAIVVRLVNRAARAVLGVPAGAGFLRLEARCPGSRETLRASIDYDRVEHDPARFNLVVQRVSRPGATLIEDQELFSAVSVSPDASRFIGDVLQQSKLVALSGPLPVQRPAATIAKHPGQAIPYLDFSPGADGDELSDYDVVGSDRAATGLFSLDRVERLDLICIPPAPGRDLGSTAFLAAERYCDRRRALLIWDPPAAWRTAEGALLGLRSAGLASPNTLAYFPRIRPRAELARFPAGMPASGALAGMLTARDARAAWRAEEPLRLWPGLTVVADIEGKRAATLHRFGVNTLSRGPGGNIRFMGDVCLERCRTVATSWQRLAARRTALFVLGSIERETRWLRGGALDAQDRRRLYAQVRVFLSELHAGGVLAGTRPEQSYFVRVIAERGNAPLTLRFGFALLEPGRFEIYEIYYMPGGIKTRIVPPLEEAEAAP
ncbi:MAG TPA: hypothetical protein VFY39_08815 [Gammaproteobacteria bacterium]|nr:hypothetical protein [Gammaproteobacteria bacterium]